MLLIILILNAAITVTIYERNFPRMVLVNFYYMYDFFKIVNTSIYE